MAIRLSKAFGSTPETWLRMQLAYDLAQARKDESKIKVRRQHVLQELRAQRQLRARRRLKLVVISERSRTNPKNIVILSEAGPNLSQRYLLSIERGRHTELPE